MSNTEKYEWEAYEIFIDEIGTKFIKLDNSHKYDYKIEITNSNGEIEEDYCDKEQLIDWNIQVSHVIL